MQVTAAVMKRWLHTLPTKQHSVRQQGRLVMSLAGFCMAKLHACQHPTTGRTAFVSHCHKAKTVGLCQSPPPLLLLQGAS